MCSCLFIFLQRLLNVSFLFILFISLIFSHSLQLSNFHLFFSTKCLTSLSLPLTIWLFSLKSSHLKLSPFPSLLIFSMAPKFKKISYVLSNDTFNLMCWNGAVRLNKSPSLTYRLQDHLSKGAKIGLVSFPNFSHFWVFLWSSILICFWPCKCLGFTVGLV